VDLSQVVVGNSDQRSKTNHWPWWIKLMSNLYPFIITTIKLMSLYPLLFSNLVGVFCF
jgi:hypothetical protein